MTSNAQQFRLCRFADVATEATSGAGVSCSNGSLVERRTYAVCFVCRPVQPRGEPSGLVRSDQQCGTRTAAVERPEEPVRHLNGECHSSPLCASDLECGRADHSAAAGGHAVLFLPHRPGLSHVVIVAAPAPI